MCLVVRRIGPALGFVDRPDDPTLKAHTQPAVPLGGVAIFVGIHLALVIADRWSAPVFVASGLLLGLGLVDDRYGLSPLLRLAVEGVAGGVLAFGVGTEQGWAVGLAVGVVVVVAVNAVNLFDGLDGLAGSAALIGALGGALLAASRGQDHLPGLIVAAALVGFLVVNWHPATVFLGDNGAYSVALFLVALIPITTTQRGAPGVIEISVGLGLLGVFLVDLGSTVLRRFLSKKPLFAGDRNHMYDRLHAKGHSVRRVALTTSAGQLLIVAVTVGVAHFLSRGWAVVVLAVFGVGLVIIVGAGPWLGSAETVSSNSD